MVVQRHGKGKDEIGSELNIRHLWKVEMGISRVLELPLVQFRCTSSLLMEAVVGQSTTLLKAEVNFDND